MRSVRNRRGLQARETEDYEECEELVSLVSDKPRGLGGFRDQWGLRRSRGTMKVAK